MANSTYSYLPNTPVFWHSGSCVFIVSLTLTAVRPGTSLLPSLFPFLLHVWKEDPSFFPEWISEPRVDACFVFSLRINILFPSDSCRWLKLVCWKRQSSVWCAATLCWRPLFGTPFARVRHLLLLVGCYCLSKASQDPASSLRISSACGHTSKRTFFSPPTTLTVFNRVAALPSGRWQTHSWLLLSVYLLLKKIIIYSLWYKEKDKKAKYRLGYFNYVGLFPGQDSAHKLKGN